MALRQIEGEFVDFKVPHYPEQMGEVYGDLFNAYKRGDKVILTRSLSSGMYKYTSNLLNEKKPNSFFRDINSLKMV
jgi:hypothetical protein